MWNGRVSCRRRWLKPCGHSARDCTSGRTTPRVLFSNSLNSLKQSIHLGRARLRSRNCEARLTLMGICDGVTWKPHGRDLVLCYVWANGEEPDPRCSSLRYGLRSRSFGGKGKFQPGGGFVICSSRPARSAQRASILGPGESLSIRDSRRSERCRPRRYPCQLAGWRKRAQSRDSAFWPYDGRTRG